MACRNSIGTTGRTRMDSCTLLPLATFTCAPRVTMEPLHCSLALQSSYHMACWLTLVCPNTTVGPTHCDIAQLTG